MSDLDLARPPAARGSLVQHAMQAVTDHIRQAGLKVGDTLPGEVHFSTALGVSRPVVREAFGALAALRLIEVANGRKPRVAAVDGSVFGASLDHAVNTAQITVPEVWEVRRTIERRTAGLAALNRSREEADAIGREVERMADSLTDLSVLTAHDVAFHEAVARASHNALYVQIVASFRQLMSVAVPVAWSTRQAAARKELMVDRHRAVARAILAGDADAATAAMDDHFDVSIGDMLSGLAARTSGDRP